MAQKSNIRSMRFSDKMIEMIESQAGETFTAKFEALVTRCMWELPQKERELAQVQKQIDYQRENLRRISKKAQDLESSIYRMTTNVQSYSNITKQHISALTKLLEDM